MDRDKQIKQINDMLGLGRIPLPKDQPIQVNPPREEVQRMVDERGEKDILRARNMFDKMGRRLLEKIQDDIDEFGECTLNTYQKMYKALEIVINEAEQKIVEARSRGIKPYPEWLLNISMGRAYSEQIQSKISELENQDQGT